MLMTRSRLVRPISRQSGVHAIPGQSEVLRRRRLCALSRLPAVLSRARVSEISTVRGVFLSKDKRDCADQSVRWPGPTLRALELLQEEQFRKDILREDVYLALRDQGFAAALAGNAR